VRGVRIKGRIDCNKGSGNIGDYDATVWSGFLLQLFALCAEVAAE
jgi:hypothetical protein